MNNIVKSALIFAAGIASGVWVSCTIIRRSIEVKYNDICEKEIADAKKLYDDRIQEELTKINDAARKKVEETVLKHDKPDISAINTDYYKEVSEAVETGIYVDENPIPIAKQDPKEAERYTWEESKKNGRAKYISDEEFFDDREYEKYYLTMYADQVIGNEMDEVVEPHHFGADGIDIYGDIKASGEKTVYMRNQELKQDFEITLDYRDYYTAVGRHPN